MESFFQAAINSVLEAAGGGSRGSRNGSSSSSRNPFAASRSNPASEEASYSSSSWRSSRYGSPSAPERTSSFAASPRGPFPGAPSSGGPSSSTPSARRVNAAAAESSRTDRFDRDVGKATRGVRGNERPAGGGSSRSRSSSSNTSSSSSSSSSNQAAARHGNAADSRQTSPVRDREAGERLKALGNESFRRGMYGLAAEYYSKAIAADGTVASYFTNRALCHKREFRFAEALRDAEAALRLEGSNVKGLYIKGDALVQLGDLEGGVALLEKAEKASSSGAARAAHEIRHSLLNGKGVCTPQCDICDSAKKLRFERNRRQLTADRKDLEAFLKDCIAVAAKQKQLPESEVTARVSQLRQLVADAETANAPFELPDCLNCRISMGLMDDPVVTPSGITYERKLLLEHINRNGPTDPLTRQGADSCAVSTFNE
ncbi:hypothetical protein Efla_002657 [Eimeria flavescens]